MNVKLDIRNATDWDTATIRRIFKQVARHKGVDHAEPYRLDVFYCRGGGGVRCDDGAGMFTASVSGYGYYHRRWAKMGLPNTVETWDSHGPTGDRIRATVASAAAFARVLEHEIDHNLGLKHKDMLPAQEIDVSYLTVQEIRRAEHVQKKPAKPSAREKAAADLAKIDAAIAREETRHRSNMKSLRTRAAKARNRLRAAERRERLKGEG